MRITYLRSGVYLVSDKAGRRLTEGKDAKRSGFNEFEVVLPDGTPATLQRRRFDVGQGRSEEGPAILRFLGLKPHARYPWRPRVVFVWVLSPSSAPTPRKLQWIREPGGAPIWISREFTDAFGRRTSAVYRIDGRRHATEGYRVDGGTIVGWEAIDGGRGRSTLKEARALADHHLRTRATSRDRSRKPRHRKAIWRRRSRSRKVWVAS